MKRKCFVLIMLAAYVLLCASAALAQTESGVPWPAFLDKRLYAEAGFHNDRMHYVNQVTGDTTVVIDAGNPDIIWLKEEAGGKSAWFGLDNSNDVFDQSSRFYVRWLDRNTVSDADTWNALYSQLDSQIKQETGHLWLFDVGVCNGSGNIVEFQKPVSLYIQLEDGWNQNDLHSCFINSGTDEKVLVSTEKLDESEELSGMYAVMQLTHFSPYALYDQAAPAVPQTGDTANTALWFVLASMSAISMVLIVRRRRNA